MKFSLKVIFAFAVMMATFISTVKASDLITGARSTVESIYHNPNAEILPYITLKEPNSMPGCHANRSGYLKFENVDRVFASILAAQRAGTDIVVYYRINEDASGWGRCSIYGLTAY